MKNSTNKQARTIVFISLIAMDWKIEFQMVYQTIICMWTTLPKEITNLMIWLKKTMTLDNLSIKITRNTRIRSYSETRHMRKFWRTKWRSNRTKRCKRIKREDSKRKHSNITGRFNKKWIARISGGQNIKKMWWRTKFLVRRKSKDKKGKESLCLNIIKQHDIIQLLTQSSIILIILTFWREFRIGESITCWN